MILLSMIFLAVLYMCLAYLFLYMYSIPIILKGYRSAIQSVLQSTTSFDHTKKNERWVCGLVQCFALEPYIAPLWLLFVLSYTNFAPHNHVITTIVGVLPLLLVHLAARLTNFWLMHVLLQFGWARISLALVMVFLTTYSVDHLGLVTFLNVIPFLLSAHLLKATMTELYQELHYLARERQHLDHQQPSEHLASH